MNRFYRLLERLEIPKKRAFLHIFATVISGGFWFIFAVAIEVFLKSERANTIVLADAYLKKTQADILAEIDVKQDVIDQMEEFREKVISTFESAFEKPFEISNVTLWESREKITTVTSGTSVGKTRAGTVGFGWSDGIGLAATQGVTRGTFTSGTTEMMKNEFTELDSGVLRIGKDFTAFIGDQFTRTAKYPEVLLINTSYVYSIGLNVLNAERAWLVRFTGEYESNLASEILNAAYSYGMNGKAPDLTSYRTEFDQEITNLKAEIKQLVIDLEETREPKLP
jgi:hypothetical protein